MNDRQHSKMVRQRWSISQLAIELGMDRRTIGGRLHEVDPCDYDGRLPRYYLKDVVAALTDSTTNALEREKIRLTSAQAEKTEIEVARTNGELIPVSEVQREWLDIASKIRSKLLAMPDRLAKVALSAQSLREVQEAIRVEIYEALNDLSMNANLENCDNVESGEPSEESVGDVSTTSDFDSE